MKFFYKMERKIGKYAIHNLMLALIICYAVGYTLQMIAPGILSWLTLEPYYILHGQVWRIFTWIIVPDSQFNLLFTLIMLYFYYSIGTNLERTWGEFRFNIYILGGILITDLAAIILYLILAGSGIGITTMGGLFSTTYINLSLFLAYALCYPEMEVLFMFVIPIKMKWMGLVYGAFTLYEIIASGWIVRTAIIASLLNFIIFFFMTRNYKKISPKQVKHRRQFRQHMAQAQNGQTTKHKCAVCGRTELDGENLEFRYCSKCDGNYEYCQDHLFTHQHIKKS